MNIINFNNLTKKEIKEEKTINEVLKFAMKKEGLHDTCFDIIFVDNSYIHKLNKEYRGIDRPTDVITFALDDDDKVINDSGVHILGDVYISVEKAEEQAKEYGHSFLREICFLAVHGFYHLLGYDHQTENEAKVMFGKQEEVLKEYGITREKR